MNNMEKAEAEENHLSASEIGWSSIQIMPNGEANSKNSINIVMQE